MYFVHLNNPTRQVRVDANNISVMDGFVTFSMRTHPEDYAPATVAVFRAEDVGVVYNQDHIESVISMPNVGSANRIPFETTQRVEPSADYAPAIIRRGSTATEARQYPPLNTPFVASWEDPIPTSDYPDTVAYPSGELLNTATVVNSALAALEVRPSGQAISFADRVSLNTIMPTRLPDLDRPTREPFRVRPDDMTTYTSRSLAGNSRPSLDAGENF